MALFKFFALVLTALCLQDAYCNVQDVLLQPSKFQVSVDGSKVTQFITHFWESTGFW